MKTAFALLLTTCLVASVTAQENSASKPASAPASKPASKPASTKSAATSSSPAVDVKFVITDCVSFKDKTLTVKFRMDENFDKHVSAQFAYPLNNFKDPQIGKLYLFTFQQAEAAHNVEKAQLIDEKNPPKELTERNMIGKVVGVTDKAVVVEFVKDENLKRFYSREQSFPIRNEKMTFSAGQVIKIAFEKDNRHCKGYAIIEDKPKQK